MKLILLNGPPRCGKDTAANLLHDLYNPTHTILKERFSFPHKLAFAGMTKKFVDLDGNVEDYELEKNSPIYWLGVSYLQWQIDFSEIFMKPTYGKTIFARMFLDRVASRKSFANYLCLLCDCGLQMEIDTVVTNWSHHDIMLLTILRDGCDFDNDSRVYVRPTNGILQMIINNQWDIPNLQAQLIEATKDFMS